MTSAANPFAFHLVFSPYYAQLVQESIDWQQSQLLIIWQTMYQSQPFLAGNKSYPPPNDASCAISLDPSLPSAIPTRFYSSWSGHEAYSFLKAQILNSVISSVRNPRLFRNNIHLCCNFCWKYYFSVVITICIETQFRSESHAITMLMLIWCHFT